jgi:hypothetical protein
MSGVRDEVDRRIISFAPQDLTEGGSTTSVAV